MAFGSVDALAGLDLTAPPAAITAVLGPNGAGKTTFIRAVATLQRYQAGSLRVIGHEVADAPALVRRSIGLAGQHAALVAKLSGRENLELVARLYGQSSRAARESAARLIGELSLEPFADRRVEAHSGGERRRLDIAATLVGNPALLLLDEPTAGLDPRSRVELWRLIRELPVRGTSIILTTQHLDEADALADWVVIIDGGCAVASGTPAELRRRTATTSLRLAIDGSTGSGADEGGAEEQAYRQIASALNAQLDRRAGAVTLVGEFGLDDAYRAIRAAGISSRISEFALQPPTLDEVFLALTRPDAEKVA